ncbi:MAG: DUF4834 domain-containing protein [Flavobacteriaceae bacterium]|nr:DUF4834 domain-containing protein [Flavobacteriaceae bacterium]
MGIILKFLLFFFGGIYLLRLLSPFLFKVLLSSLIRKANQSKPPKTSKKRKNKTVSDSLGEYVDYEEME